MKHLRVIEVKEDLFEVNDYQVQNKVIYCMKKRFKSIKNIL